MSIGFKKDKQITNKFFIQLGQTKKTSASFSFLWATKASIRYLYRGNFPFLFLGIAILFFCLSSNTKQTFTLCPFMNFTGLPCPGCGGVRAFHSLLHGDIKIACKYNFFATVFYLLCLCILIIRCLPTKFRFHFYHLTIKNLSLLNKWLTFLISLWFLFSVLRIIDNYFHLGFFINLKPDFLLKNLIQK